MKSLLVLCISLSWKTLQAQKILVDDMKPISNTRTILTELLPVFKMKVIQVAAMAELKPSDSVFVLAFYISNLYRIETQQVSPDTARKNCVVLLADGSKVIGCYSSTSTGLGMQIMSYNFASIDFKRLSVAKEVIAFSIDLPNGIGTSEYTLDDKFKKSIPKVCEAIIKKVVRI